MADLYAVPGETLTGIADAIRSQTGSDEQLTVAAMAAAIEGISSGISAYTTYITPAEDTKEVYIDGVFSENYALIITSQLAIGTPGSNNRICSAGKLHLSNVSSLRDALYAGTIYSVMANGETDTWSLLNFRDRLKITDSAGKLQLNTNSSFFAGGYAYKITYIPIFMED